MNISKYDGLSSFLDFYDLKKNELISKIILKNKNKSFFFAFKKRDFQNKDILFKKNNLYFHYPRKNKMLKFHKIYQNN